MYKVTGIDVKNNRYKVLDTSFNIESICTREQILQSRGMGFNVFGVLSDSQIVVWDTFYKLSMLSDNNKKKLLETLKDYNIVVVTDDGTINDELIGNCLAFNFSNCTNMLDVFSNCKAASLDLRNFDTSDVTIISSMFNGCEVKSLDLSSFDTSKVIDMNCMFEGCRVKSLDLSGFDTSNVTNMFGMFSDCSAVSLDLSSFDTSNVTNMVWMFKRCEAVKLDLRNFDISKVTNMKGMFKVYSGKEIILRKTQKRLINQAKKDRQEGKIKYV